MNFTDSRFTPNEIIPVPIIIVGPSRCGHPELKAGDRLDTSLTIHIGLPGFEGQFLVSAPHHHMLDLLLVGRLINVVSHRRVVCKLDNYIGTVYRCEDGVEERTQHTALVDTGVQGEGSASKLEGVRCEWR